MEAFRFANGDSPTSCKKGRLFASDRNQEARQVLLAWLFAVSLGTVGERLG